MTQYCVLLQHKLLKSQSNEPYQPIPKISSHHFVKIVMLCLFVWCGGSSAFYSRSSGYFWNSPFFLPLITPRMQCLETVPMCHPSSIYYIVCFKYHLWQTKEKQMSLNFLKGWNIKPGLLLFMSQLEQLQCLHGLLCAWLAMMDGHYSSLLEMAWFITCSLASV